MRFLIVGAWAWPQYETAFSRGLTELGHEVVPLPVGQFGSGLWGRLKSALSLPSRSSHLDNRRVVAAASTGGFDVILFWRTTSIYPKTIKLLSKRTPCVSYNNDDPFGKSSQPITFLRQRMLWRLYRRCLKFFDLNLFYRHINLEESKNYGSKRSGILLPYFDPIRDHPVELSSTELDLFGTQVAFVGHFESDGRDALLLRLLKEGVRLKVYGDSSWKLKASPELQGRLGEINPARGIDYAKALAGAEVCIAFLSKLNRDRYTRRCFEIPAIGGLLLAERTPELKEMFVEDQEACFFDGEEELVSKVLWLLENPIERNRIARAGQKRVWKDGHDLKSRTSQFVKLCEDLISGVGQP